MYSYIAYSRLRVETPAGMLGGSAAIRNYDFTAQLPSLQVPLLPLRGDGDPDGTAKAMRRLAELVRGATDFARS